MKSTLFRLLCGVGLGCLLTTSLMAQSTPVTGPVTKSRKDISKAAAQTPAGKQTDTTTRPAQGTAQAPRDQASGQATGRRQHTPITISKSQDKATPATVAKPESLDAASKDAAKMKARPTGDLNGDGRPDIAVKGSGVPNNSEAAKGQASERTQSPAPVAPGAAINTSRSNIKGSKANNPTGLNPQPLPPQTGDNARNVKSKSNITNNKQTAPGAPPAQSPAANPPKH